MRELRSCASVLRVCIARRHEGSEPGASSTKAASPKLTLQGGEEATTYAITGSDVDELWHHLGDARSKGSAAQRGTTTEPSTVVASGLTEATNQQRILHHLTIWIHLHITDDAKVSCI